ncbi:MAG TPA: hypothetical protein VMG11_15865 [Steroidobacteraceae bacterium]|nr:hypothetical protein [Steroidobacteraceae bacterium]
MMTMTSVQNQAMKIVICAAAALALNAVLAWGAVKSTAEVAPVRHWITMAQYMEQTGRVATSAYTHANGSTTAALVE